MRGAGGWFFAIAFAFAVHIGLTAMLFLAEEDGMAEADTGGAFDTVLTVTLNDGVGAGAKGGDTDRLAGTEAVGKEGRTEEVEQRTRPDTEAEARLETDNHSAPADLPLDPKGNLSAIVSEHAPLPAREFPAVLSVDPASTPESEKPASDVKDEQNYSTPEPRAMKAVEVPNEPVKLSQKFTAPSAAPSLGSGPAEAPKPPRESAEHSLEKPHEQTRIHGTDLVTSKPGSQNEGLQTEKPTAVKPVLSSEPQAEVTNPVDVPRSGDFRPKDPKNEKIGVPHKAPEWHYEARQAVVKEARRAVASRKAANAKQRKKAAQAPRRGDARETTKRGDIGKGNSAAVRAAKGNHTSYSRKLRQWVERHKRYPAKARDQGVTGRGTLKITIARSGKVLSSALIKSTGHGALDNSLKTLPRRASPFPKMPKSLTGSRLTFQVPVRFTQ